MYGQGADFLISASHFIWHRQKWRFFSNNYDRRLLPECKIPVLRPLLFQWAWNKKPDVVFCASKMAKNKRTYNFIQLFSSVMMIFLLMWLTVSTPFVLASQQEVSKGSKTPSSQSPLNGGSEEESTNPFGNGTEEKMPKNISSFSEEFLHDQHRSDHLFSISKQYHKTKDAGTYTAFHGELLVPPPNRA